MLVRSFLTRFGEQIIRKNVTPAVVSSKSLSTSSYLLGSKDTLKDSPNAKFNKSVLHRFQCLPQPDNKCIVTYVWIDGTGEFLRCKDRVVDFIPEDGKELPDWQYDGSSTYQAHGGDSDLTLKPRTVYPDPFRPGNHRLVICETFKSDGSPTDSNHRDSCSKALEQAAKDEVWFGVEQEYTLLEHDGSPLGWPRGGYPAPQGPYYCGVGADRVYGRDIVEAHFFACLYAEVPIAGTNAEVMPSQWEFQNLPTPGVKAADDVWISRFILQRVAEEFGVVVSFDPKPMPGNWNGAGAHTNISTAPMRVEGGIKEIEKAIEKLSKRHPEHIKAYDPKGGLDNTRRLLGALETSSIDKFSSGVANRGVSIRIPRGVANAGKGYLEDRRPSSNMDPYAVFDRLVRTICLNE